MKIFIINLKSSLDRKNHMKNEIKKIQDQKSGENFEFIFFDAIDKNKIKEERFCKHFNDFYCIFYSARKLSDEEKACYASHFCLWEKCIELNEPVIILEDDIIFESDFIEGVKNIINSPYECVRLSFLSIGKIDFYQLNENFWITHDTLSGAQGYYLTPSGAKKFLAKSQKYWLKPVDGFMDYSYIHNVEKVTYSKHLLKEITLIQEKQNSNFNREITTNIPSREKTSFKHLKKNLHRIFRLSIKLRMHLYEKNHSLDHLSKTNNPYHVPKIKKDKN